MGKGDPKTRKGKVFRESFGKSRLRKKPKTIPDASMRMLLRIRRKITNTNYADLSKDLNSILVRIPIPAIDVLNKPFSLGQRDSGGLNLFYRARVNDSTTNAPWNHYNNITYVQSADLAKITSFGRVNKPGESMFYCATELTTACIETFTKGINLERLKKSGSLMLTVGVWKLVDDLIVAKMVHSEKNFNRFRKLLKHFTLKKVSSVYVRKSNEVVRKLISNEKEYKVLEFFSEEFAKTDTHNHLEYQLSNYYADRVFNRIPKLIIPENIDGIMYPSIPTVYEDYNFVFPPHIVDSKLQFLWAHDIWVTFSERHGMVFHPIKQKIKPDSTGKFNW